MSLLLAGYSLTLPNCPTSKVEKSKSWFSVLGLDALVLFRQRRMALLFLFAMLLGAALQITNTFGNSFLAYGTPAGFGFVLLLLSMIVYGCAFDFFNISGAIFVEKEADHRIRASAQGLFMTMVNGVGAYLGAIASGEVVDFFTHNAVKDWQSIWLIFALYTLVLGIVFTLTFNYRHDLTAFGRQAEQNAR